MLRGRNNRGMSQARNKGLHAAGVEDLGVAVAMYLYYYHGQALRDQGTRHPGNNGKGKNATSVRLCAAAAT
jgi:hypothetical protein